MKKWYKMLKSKLKNILFLSLFEDNKLGRMACLGKVKFWRLVSDNSNK